MTDDATCCGVIVEQAPGSLDELARSTGRAKSSLSRTLKTPLRGPRKAGDTIGR